MPAVTHVLVPVDFGEPANRALELGIELAESYGAELTLLHVGWLPPSSYGPFADGLYWPGDGLEVGARQALEKLLAKTKERCPTAQGLIVAGDPAQTILEVAGERGADLVIMGTHGRRGLSRVFLGSVAERVVRLSHVPVLTISANAAETEEAAAGAPR